MERDSAISLTTEERNNLISLCEAIRDNKPQQFKKCLKKLSHRSEFLLSQSVTIRAKKTEPAPNGKLTGDPLYFAIHYARNEMQKELNAKGANNIVATKNLFQSIPTIILDGESIETSQEFNLEVAKKILNLIEKNNVQELELLLKGIEKIPSFPAILNATYGEFRHNFLIKAVLLNLPQITKLLCQAGIKINYATPGKKITALHIACEKGSLECLEILIEHGASINAETRDKQTPLYIAAYYGYDEIVQYLCVKQADINISNIDKFNPLHIAVMENKIKCAEILLNYFPNLEVEGKDALTPLLLAVHLQHNDIVGLLLAKKANPNYSRNPDFTPLYKAVEKNNSAIIDLLLRNGADINLARADDGATPLMIACFHGNLDIVERLLETKKIIIEKNSNIYQQSCLTAALYGANKATQALIIDKLCHYGFDPLQIDTITGVPPLLHALKEKNEPVLEVFAYYVTRNFLDGRSTANLNNLRIVDAHRKYRIDKSDSLLMLELVYKISYFQAARILIKYGAYGDIPTPDGKYKSINEWVKLNTEPKHSHQEQTNTQSENKDFYQAFESNTNNNIVSGFKCLQLNGYTPDEIAKLKESAKQVGVSKQIFFKTNSAVKTHHWCNAIFKSTDENIHAIMGTPNCYVYIAEDSLTDCPPDFLDKLKSLNFKFNNTVVKKLKLANSEINTSFNLVINQQTYQADLTHEIKFPQIKARILLFELIDKPTGATLYIGAKYLKNGLHTQADLDSLKQSSKVIFINYDAENNNNTNIPIKSKLSM